MRWSDGPTGGESSTAHPSHRAGESTGVWLAVDVAAVADESAGGWKCQPTADGWWRWMNPFALGGCLVCAGVVFDISNSYINFQI